VLSAYAIRNPTLLYCQGMNYIVAYLLINEMSQEHVFWFLACLVENILPDDYFKDLTTISIVSYIFNDILG
jgi:isoprenylcysteine carboxyl methyltransferase (ICMT) family protein YpbQ